MLTTKQTVNLLKQFKNKDGKTTEEAKLALADLTKQGIESYGLMYTVFVYFSSAALKDKGLPSRSRFELPKKLRFHSAAELLESIENLRHPDEDLNDLLTDSAEGEELL